MMPPVYHQSLPAIRMNHPVSVFLATLTVVGLVYSATIPSDIKGCKRSDPNVNKCVIKTLNILLPAFVDGYKKYAIPVLDPFHIDHLALSESNGRGLDIAVDFKDVKVKGIKDAVVQDGTTVDTKEQKLYIEVSLPNLILDAIYNVDGKVLLLPIKGEGDANLTLGQMKIHFVSDYTIHKGKDGKDYAQLANSKLDFTVEKFGIYLANLFNGDKTLGEQTNTFLNVNGQEVLKEFGPIVRETVKTIIFTVVNNVALKVPFDVLLPL